jgi:alpha-ketoglutarate-dependent taurine dioxygenase
MLSDRNFKVNRDGVLIEYQSSSRSLPLLISPLFDRVNLLAWAKNNWEFINTHLQQFGSLLFRNFNVGKVEEFQKFIELISQSSLLEYTNRSTPRTQVSGRIYTSTEYSPKQSILLHNENSYSSTWPMKIGFFCVQPSPQGGETPLADSRKVFQRIHPTIRKQFTLKQVMYVRNYGEIDLPWQTTFQTESKSEVERYCNSTGIKFEWRGSEKLRTHQVCQAVAKHPNTHEMVWFNQAHLFHISSLPPVVRESLLDLFAEDDIPRNSYYGDGSPIEDSVLDEIRGIYQEEAVTFSWNKGDILILDNMLTAHGRMPFSGERKVLVGMS